MIGAAVYRDSKERKKEEDVGKQIKRQRKRQEETRTRRCAW
jgi:hypothetical protein